MKPPFRGKSFGGRSNGPKPFGDRKPWDRGGSFGGDRGDRRGGGRSFDRPPMHPATCNQCGNACEVPFRPNGSRPIFCNNCFKRDDSHDADKFKRRDDDRRPSYGDKSSYRPSTEWHADKPARVNTDQLTEQIAALNGKLDTVLKMLAAQSAPKAATVAPTAEKKAASETVKAPAKKKAVKKMKKQIGE